jgi:ribosome maturation protein Sdo1
MIEKAMSEVGYSVKSDKAAKAQALELIKKLAEGDILPIRRMRMRIRVTMPAKDAKRIGEKIKAEGEVEEEDAGEEWEVVSWHQRARLIGRSCRSSRERSRHSAIWFRMRRRGREEWKVSRRRGDGVSISYHMYL